MHSEDNRPLFVDNISRSFCLAKSGWFGPKKDIHSLRNLSLRVAQGEVVGIIDKPAAGKNMLVRTLLGLVKPEAG